MKKLKTIIKNTFGPSSKEIRELQAWARNEYKNDTTFASEMVRVHGHRGVEVLSKHFGN